MMIWELGLPQKLIRSTVTYVSVFDGLLRSISTVSGS